MNLSAIPFQNKDVYYCKVEDEGLLVHNQQGKIRTINFVGDFIWNAMDGKNSIHQIIDLVKQEFNHQSDTIQSDVIHFLKELNDRSLIYLNQV